MSDLPEPSPSSNEPFAAPKSSKLPFFAAGCGAMAVVALLIPIVTLDRCQRSATVAQQQAEAAQEQSAKEEFSPALGVLTAGGARNEPYDIDETIRVVHDIDMAMEGQTSMEQYLSTLSKQDYRRVAPEMLDDRKRILELQFALYAKQTEAADREATWEFTSKLLLSTLSVVSVSGTMGAVSPEGSFSVDRAQARQLLEDVKTEQEQKRALSKDITGLQEQLFTAMYDYSSTYWKYVDEWDRLCTLRDRAYLGARNDDWATVIAASDKAIEMNPNETEAHLLKAMALIEGGNPEDLSEAKVLLDDYMKRHPGETAPALLLMGVVLEKEGDHAAAELSFQQSAAYYPKQAAELTDMLDPYKMRSYLRKSREGGYIIEQYQSMMLGAGYFSPDLQMAKVAFDDGDFYDGKQKVMDHFARRRSQQQWAFILQDIEFAHTLLGEQFRDIFPEDSYLDLKVTKPMMGAGINVAIDNRSDKTLHNATLILAVHFTDMHPADYEPFAAPRTIPAVLTHETTDFGTIDVKTDLFGVDKDVQDIVQHRAVLLTDEAVFWVDTDEYKIAEAKEFREARKSDRPVPEQKQGWHQEMATDMSAMAADLGKTGGVEVVPKYGFNDSVKITLPKALSVFKPVFTLNYGGQQYKAKTNVIDGENIVLTFDGVANFDDGKTPTDDMVLTMNSVFGDFVVTWTAEGSMKFDYDSTKAQ